MQLLERDFEDWACENIALVLGRDDAYLMNRQMRLPSGRVLDVLAGRENDSGLYIVELKASPATTDAVVQILQYMGEMRERYPSDYFTIHGIIAAPGIDKGALECVRGVANLDYVEITVSIDCIQHFEPAAACASVVG